MYFLYVDVVQKNLNFDKETGNFRTHDKSSFYIMSTIEPALKLILGAPQ